MQGTRRKTLLSFLLVAVMTFTMIQINAITTFAAGEISSLDITCSDYDPSVVQVGNTVPQPTGTGFPVTITTQGVYCPADSVYGAWYVEDTPGNWQPAQGQFESGKIYAFRIDFDGISPEQTYTFATAMDTSVNGQSFFTWHPDNPWDNVNGTGWLMSPPVSLLGPAVSQATVTFRIANGTWDGTDASDKTVTVTLANGKGTLAQGDIPTGMIADPGYEEPGQWDVVPNTATDAIVGDTVYTFTFSPIAQGPVGPQPGVQPPAGTQPSGQSAAGTTSPSGVKDPSANNTAQKAKSSAPSTGDNSNAPLAILFLSLATLSGGLVLRKKGTK